MHANICSYTKAVLEDVMEHDYEGCHSDYLLRQHPASV